MNLDNFIDSLARLGQELPELVAKNIEIAAMDGFFLVERRLLEKGTNSEGGAFSPYSPGYEAYKKRKGKHVGYVNFKLSGHMLASIGIIEKKDTGSKFFVTVAGRDKFTQDVMDGNEKTRKGWLNMSTAEIKIVEKDLEVRMQEQVNNYFE